MVVGDYSITRTDGICFLSSPNAVKEIKDKSLGAKLGEYCV